MSNMVHALRSRRVITPAGERDVVVLLEAERIVAIKPASDVGVDVPVEDLGNLALLPGLIDAHTHINEPGRTEWEGFATATRAAAAGGFTTLVDMPLNCLPETTSVTALELKRQAAQGQCMVDYAFWGGCVDGNQQQLEPLAHAGVSGFKSFLINPGCDGFTAIDRSNLERALPHIVRTGLPLLVHAELEPSISAATKSLNAAAADWHKYATYLASRPDVAELEAIEMLLDLCRTYRFRLHIVHLSTSRALPLLAAAKREGLPVTVETCPHFLHCAAEDIPDGATLFKCAPPIRNRANQDRLWQALRDGTIDFIATDHSPCLPEMKHLRPPDGLAAQPDVDAGRFDLAWGGIPSLSTALSVLWTECVRRGIPLHRLSEWTSAAPSRLVGLTSQIGSIEPGKHANLIAFDTEASFTLTPHMLHYRHKTSPYIGETLSGLVHSTWLRGQRIFTRGTVGAPRSATADIFAAAPPGREYAVSRSLNSLETR